MTQCVFLIILGGIKPNTSHVLYRPWDEDIPVRSKEMAKLRNELKQMENDWKTQLANVQATRTETK